MRYRLCAALATAIALAALSARADDSSAALGAGGIQFTKMADIRMASEDLRLSPDAVRIRYEFVNDSNKDIETVVAFPLPDIDAYEFWGTPIGRLTDDPVNFVGFKAVVNGKSVAVTVEQKATYNGHDVTAIVRSAGLPVNIVSGRNYQRMDKLTPAQKRTLTKAGLAEFDNDQGIARWIIQTRFYWTQRFPAHKTVTIEHSYKPVTGQAFFSEYDLKSRTGSSDDYWKKPYCMDEGTLTRVRQAIAEHKAANRNEGLLNAYSTAFILKTANNWKGGIGRFHLTLDKLKPENTLSLCWDGELKKTGATIFESTRQDFAPQHDIKFVVLE
ncbi:MAG TPA: DUF4424 family protein [Rhizomicrobium sp.]|jgi:hypothetical protein